MTSIAIETERRPIAEILPTGGSDDVVYITENGKPKFLIVPFDEGDEEVMLLRQNPAFMEYLDRSIERARNQPCKSIDQIESELLGE